MPKNHACEEKQLKCTKVVSFCRNCKFVKCRHKINEFFYSVGYISQTFGAGLPELLLLFANCYLLLASLKLLLLLRRYQKLLLFYLIINIYFGFNDSKLNDKFLIIQSKNYL